EAFHQQDALLMRRILVAVRHLDAAPVELARRHELLQRVTIRRSVHAELAAEERKVLLVILERDALDAVIENRRLAELARIDRAVPYLPIVAVAHVGIVRVVAAERR